MRFKISTLLAVSIILTGYISSAIYLQSARDSFVKNNIGAYKSYIPPSVLKIIAGEFKGLLGNYTLIEAASIVGSGKLSANQWESIAYRYRQTMELDPWFDQSCHLIQGTLPWNTDKKELTYSLINKSRESRYWDWTPGYFLGFNYFYFEKNYKKASELLLDTAKRNNAPKLLATFGARLAQQGGQNKIAIHFLQSMYDKEESEDVKRMLQKRIKTHLYIEVLEATIAKYTSDYSKKPSDLNDLVTKGYLEKIEKTPYNKEFKYDNETGIIGF